MCHCIRFWQSRQDKIKDADGARRNMLVNNNLDVDILVNDKPLKKIAHEGKLYVVARKGREYEIRLKNNNTHRVTGVCSVDGLNVISGKAAQEKDTGYIINGYGSYTVKGFRTSDEEVHPFRFNDKKISYAAKSDNGNKKDCGVVGVVFWAEKEKPIPAQHWHYNYYYEPLYYRPRHYIYGYGHEWGQNQPSFTCNLASSGGNQMSAMNCSSQGEAKVSSFMRSAEHPRGFDLGTEFSDQSVEDKVDTVDFDWGRKLAQIEIYYASEQALRDMGVPIHQASSVTFPQSFPGSFCKPPKA